MIQKKLLRGLTLALAIMSVAHIAAFANGTRDLKVGADASLNGTLIKAGEYRMRWQANSPEVTVTLIKGDKVVATAHGKMVERDVKTRGDKIVYRLNPDGSRTITEIRLAGTSQAIVFEK